MSALLDRLRSPRAIRQFLEEALPFVDLDFEGVSQVSAGVVTGGRYWMTRVGEPGAPKSAIDRVVLELARTRADAVLLTGRILRAEPSLSYAPLTESFAALRTELGRSNPPRLFILTRSFDLPPAHPVFRELGTTVTLLSANENASENIARLPPGIRRIKLDTPTVAAAIATIKSEGCRTISVEAGPNAVRELYAEDSPLDELLFARFLLESLSRNEAERDADPRRKMSWLTAPFVDASSLASLFARREASAIFEGDGTPTIVERHLRS